MILTHLRFQNYKAFESEYNLEIKPLTILIGPNSSGKSVIARLPLLLERGFSGQSSAPLDLEFDSYDFAGVFKELVYNHSPRNNIRLGFSFKDDLSEDWSVAANIQYFDEYHIQIVESFELHKGNKRLFKARWAGNDPDSEPDRYAIDTFHHDFRIEFSGMIPSLIKFLDGRTIPKKMQTHLMGIVLSGDHKPVYLQDYIRQKFKVNYLGPFREKPRRMYRFSGGRPSDVGPGGSFAPQMLAQEASRKERKVLDDLGQWFYKHLGKWKLDVVKEGIGFSLVMSNPENPNIQVNLRDVGTGIAQVLPMVVQRMFDSVHGATGGLEVVEQPELHLHPQSHGDLADLYVKASQKVDSRFLIETHSEIFLLRLRRRIAEGTLDPDNVIFYWIKGESGKDKITPIHINEKGETDTWPTDVFSDAYKEVTAIRRARKIKKGQEGVHAG